MNTGGSRPTVASYKTIRRSEGWGHAQRHVYTARAARSVLRQRPIYNSDDDCLFKYVAAPNHERCQ